jgi:hypothetical protein
LISDQLTTTSAQRVLPALISSKGNTLILCNG